MLLLGHRGSPRHFPENTLASFAHALERGLDGLETDARSTRDGRFVIHHDAHLPDGRLIAALTQREVLRGFPHIPPLEGFLEWALAQRDFHLNLELKSEDTATDGKEARLVQTLERLLPAHSFLHQNLVLSCFNPLSLWRMARSSRVPLKLGYLYHPNILHPLIQRASWNLPLYSVHPHFSVLSPALLERARRRGLRVFAWTVNAPEQVRQFRAWGVDALIGDLPEVLLSAKHTSS